MSIKLMNRVWKHSRAKGTARLVLLAIADHCNTAGVAWPSLTRLASYVNVDRRNVITAVNRLIEMGELERIKTGKTGVATTYKVVLTSDASVTSDGIVTSDATVTQLVMEASPQPSLNRQESLLGPQGFDAFWKAYPKKVGKGGARTAYQRAVKKAPHEVIMAGLAKYSPDPDYICNPTTWLNQERWSDEPTDYTKTTGRSPSRQGGGELIDAYSRFASRRETVN